MTVKKYDHNRVEKKWQQIWSAKKLYSPDLKRARKPFYNLMMFPYPSAEGLHVGNMYAFTGADVYGRFNRMQGFEVFEPIGLDGFGIHSENYAIKVGRHPQEHAEISEKNFYRQLSMIGNGFDWTKKLETYDANYYKWTQWLFIKMFKAGLAYKGSAMVNWCPSCKTVLADEQVVAHKAETPRSSRGNISNKAPKPTQNETEKTVCERCGTEVERREMSSWYFKITNYADRLLENIDKIDWPEKIKTAQRQWIGKSKGLTINFQISGLRNPKSDIQNLISVWTKFWETVYGVTFIVVSPEFAKEKLLHAVPETYAKGVKEYIQISLNKSEQARREIKEKSGVDTGIFAINPVNGEEVPVFVADYVLANVGTGAVMGVPAHDERDFDFAKKYNLEILQVVSYSDEEINKKVKNKEIAYEGEGLLVNSGNFDGMDAWGEGKEKIAVWMIKKGYAGWEVNYHLRDWLISRQRYWGPPIPMIYCNHCAELELASKGEAFRGSGWFPVPEKDLPVVLPDIKDFKPQGDGTSPLHNAPETWKNVKCPNCGKRAERELDVTDVFLDSSWYFLAYPNLDTKEWKGNISPFNKELTKKWLPVNAYIGGAEHAVLHLLYSRFVTMFLKDKGYLNIEEPFPFLFGHGLIVKDGAKMSKSKGNIVNPDEYIEKFGADTLRTYLMFLGPFDQGGDFRDSGMEGMSRFILRIWSAFINLGKSEKEDKEITTKMHQTIKKVTSDLSTFNYNTAISAIMEYLNLINKKSNYSQIYLETLAKLIAPFAPHIAEEVWSEVLGHDKESIHTASWPKFDEKYLVSDEVNILVQVNGKLRSTLLVAQKEAFKKEILIDLSSKDGKVSKWLEGKVIKNAIVVPGRLVNFVVV